MPCDRRYGRGSELAARVHPHAGGGWAHRSCWGYSYSPDSLQRTRRSGPPWFRATFRESAIRRTEAWVLGGVEIVYCATIVITTFALIPLLILQFSSRKAVRARFWTTRCLVLAISVLGSAGVAEAVAVACLWATSIPMPWLRARFEDRLDDTVTDILVVGESSAQGVPYEKWLSVADIVAWKLRTAFPRKDFRIVNQATPGISLQAMHTKLAEIQRRPELVILYAGHNEFSSRFDWEPTEPSITPTKHRRQPRRSRAWPAALLH